VINLTKRQRYGVEIILDIALHQTKDPVSVLKISRRQGISSSYIEQIIAKFKRAHLVKSTRGPGGGYRIAGELEDITIMTVLNALEDCSPKAPSPGLTESLWETVSAKTNQFLQNVTIAQIFENEAKVVNL
jgi:Rrf2 family transcriptional regulator, iron-sulfur cluster assembly transcription factor